MILLIDNYDSFTYNLYQYIGIFNSDIKVVRNDKITIDEITAMDPERIVLSPGSKKSKKRLAFAWMLSGNLPERNRFLVSVWDISVLVRH